jgi:hypothetical protein
MKISLQMVDAYPQFPRYFLHFHLLLLLLELLDALSFMKMVEFPTEFAELEVPVLVSLQHLPILILRVRIHKILHICL